MLVSTTASTPLCPGLARRLINVALYLVRRESDWNASPGLPQELVPSLLVLFLGHFLMTEKLTHSDLGCFFNRSALLDCNSLQGGIRFGLQVHLRHS
jgi:hypothetical protein